MPKNKFEQINFDPSKHVVSPEKGQNIFKPEHFVSLEAIVDREKAGEEGFRKLSLTSVFEGKEMERSPSYAFLGK